MSPKRVKGNLSVSLPPDQTQMRIQVFNWNHDPERDRRDYVVSKSQAIELLRRGSHYWLNDYQIQGYVPVELQIAGGSFSEAWKVRGSGPNNIPVWQMATRDYRRVT